MHLVHLVLFLVELEGYRRNIVQAASDFTLLVIYLDKQHLVPCLVELEG